RDALGLALGTGEQPVCDDFERASAEYAAMLGPDLLPRALAAIDLACQRVKSNVSPQLAIEAMLFDIKEMLSCHS
ncbi:MAG: DNA polymerase III subunit delta', partial [Atopobiaceae bacterium]|nr:DNA polymerase III subunit delta' [Atopobiaceae bacterium]